MRQLVINMILPFPVTKPVGGARIMYEYANRLHARGHAVRVFHSIKRPFKTSSTPLLYKQFVFKLRNVDRPKWFPLHAGIQSAIVPEITDKYIPDADITMSTWWQMTYAISALSASKGKKFNLVQDYETWAGQVEKVDASFLLPVNHLVIANYLQKLIIEKTNGKVNPIHIPNAIDNSKFHQLTDPHDRNPHSVIMLYSEEPRKDSRTGIEALKIVQKEFSDLSLLLFGVYPMPANLPGFARYVQKPSDLCERYNSSAVFLSPSLGEGWALPPAEAMACGCAVVCTNIGGHRDYAIDGETALLVEPGNAEDMAVKIRSLFSDNELRLRLASAGRSLISTHFNWDDSVSEMETAFLESLKK